MGITEETFTGNRGPGLNTEGGVNGIVMNGGDEEIQAGRPEDDKEVAEADGAVIMGIAEETFTDKEESGSGASGISGE